MALGPDSSPVTRPHRRLPETKPFYLTSEFGITIVTSLAILIASALVDNPSADDPDGGFGARGAWLMITIIVTSYILSRGIAKAGSREHWDN